MLSYQDVDQDDNDSSFGEILHVLWLKKNLIIIVTLIIAVLGTTIILQLVPRYTATAELLIEDNQTKASDIVAIMSKDGLMQRRSFRYGSD